MYIFSFEWKPKIYNMKTICELLKVLTILSSFTPRDSGKLPNINNEYLQSNKTTSNCHTQTYTYTPARYCILN